jgi:hypothetical protein
MPNPDSQLELFSGEKDTYSANIIRQGRGHFFSRMRGYEKTVLLIFAFALTAIVSFSLGVKKGERFTSAAQPPFRAQATVTVIPQPAKTDAAVGLPGKNTAAGQYTIQLASYKSRSSAQGEMENLKKKGLLATVVPKGQYVILCLGSFNDKETAKSQLTELTKLGRYKGCFIRRL